MTTLDQGGLVTRLEELGLGPIPEFAEAHVLKKPLDIGRSYLADILRSLVECDPILAYSSIQWPNDIFTADLTVPLPKLSRGSDPKSLGIDLRQRFPSTPLFVKPVQDGVHLRFILTSKTLPRLLLPYIDDRKVSYGKDLLIGLKDPSSSELERKKVVVEFSSPNIASEFHAKHLRSTILGAYVANQYECMGWNVVKLNYLGDWGKQIGLLGVGWERLGSEEAFKANPIGHMLDVYNQIDALFQPELHTSRTSRDNGEDTAAIETQGIFAERNGFFKRMEDSDEKALALWKRFRDASIEHYVRLYGSMNITFDDYSGESQVSPATMDEVEDLLKTKGISEESEGAWIVDLEKHGGKPGRVIIRDRNGSRTYNLREVSTILDRFRKYSFDKMIFVVANDHDPHFSRIKKILELLDLSELAQKLEHVNFNKGSQTSDHGHMLGDILEQAKNSMHASLQENSERATLLGHSDESASALGISALLAQGLFNKRGADHPLEMDKATAFGRGTGPELQYWYSKVCSLLGAAIPELSALSDQDFETIEEEKYTEMLRILAQYPEITTLAYKNLEPSTVMLYLWNITDQLSVCLEIEEGEERSALTPAQAALFKAVRQVLENGMKLLGITRAV
ncbi:arginyl-tRNA synthetase [Leptodontidium sp. 2 PMI_412]|nr:arginyl-tRNA synthetase [Leptodontidium sp. 2 PMI_412]